MDTKIPVNGFGKGINPSRKEQAKKLLKLCMNIHLGGF
jgi:hypothetical protein